MSVPEVHDTDPGTLAALRGLPPSTWLRAAGVAVVVYLAIGIPTDVVPNPVFGRPTVDVRWWDPLVLGASALLMGLVIAIRPADVGGVEASSTTERTTLLGGVGSLLAVGCPTCNQLVVAVLGTSGALSFFQPVQPWLGVASLVLLTWLVRRRIDDLRRTDCPI
ncbi:MAG: hypothetical protein AAFZ07_05095 [Actinomycetota bacterium]